MRPSFPPSRFTESVLIWLIFTQERFGSFAPVSSQRERKASSWFLACERAGNHRPGPLVKNILAKHEDRAVDRIARALVSDRAPGRFAFEDDPEANEAMD
jgi:hypothetical protein